MSKSNNPKESKMIWTRSTDKYGRSVHHLRNEQMRTLGVVVKIPRQTAGHFPAPYFSNNWSKDNIVTYHSSLKVAKAYLEASV